MSERFYLSPFIGRKTEEISLSGSYASTKAYLRGVAPSLRQNKGEEMESQFSQAADHKCERPDLQFNEVEARLKNRSEIRRVAPLWKREGIFLEWSFKTAVQVRDEIIKRFESVEHVEVSTKDALNSCLLAAEYGVSLKGLANWIGVDLVEIVRALACAKDAHADVSWVAYIALLKKIDQILI